MASLSAWRIGLVAAGIAPLLALASFPALSPWQRAMLLLVTTVGGVSLHFAHRYLAGRPNPWRFVGPFIAAVACASLVVATDSLPVLALAWTGTSLWLHQLLTYSAGRPAAEIVAHKKFLLSRAADVAMIAATILLVRSFDVTSISAMLARAEAMPTLPTAVNIAGLLIAVAVVMRSAQFPFHGWLIGVMEAPTPVSALLHAGIVNLGAYVMIAMSPLMARIAGAQALLVIFGALTAIGATLVLMTRGTIKGALAWSTAAQMGFVLVECGIGAYDLALLHTLAHALYKAHAFLSSGSVVANQAARRTVAGRLGYAAWSGALLLATGLVAVIATYTWAGFADRTALQLSAAILALGLTPLLAHGLASGHRLRAIGITVAMPLGYAVLHALFAGFVPEAMQAMPLPEMALIAGIAFTLLLTAQVAIAEASHRTTVQRLRVHAHAGFHLDEIFTRLTFRVWPPATTPPRPASRMAAPAIALERAA